MIRRLAALVLLVVLVGCLEEKKSGPVDIQWGREVCTHCGMIIDDPRFAAQVRGGPSRKIFKFDDLGDALLWLAKQGWGGDPATEIWVGDMDTGTWIDARKALYVRVKATPMGHGFGASLAPKEDALPFEAVRQLVLARGTPGSSAHEAHGHAHDAKGRP